MGGVCESTDIGGAFDCTVKVTVVKTLLISETHVELPRTKSSSRERMF